jgi:hypothetical protein
MKVLKTTLLFAALICFGSGAFAQSKTNLTGAWKVAVVNVPDQFFMNIDKDSLHIGDKMMTQLNGSGDMDSATKAMTIGMLKSSLAAGFKSMTINIDDKGGIYESSKNEKIGQYDAAKNTITVTDKETKVETTLPVEIKNGLLKLSLKGGGENVELWCRKA